MKVPPNHNDDHLVSNSVTHNTADLDDGLNEPHSPSQEGDFSEYLWMENEEEFEQQIMQQLEEEALMQQCIEAMQADMELSSNNQNGSQTTSNDALTCGIQNLSVNDNTQTSKLNPNAAEFVPRTTSSNVSQQ